MIRAAAKTVVWSGGFSLSVFVVLIFLAINFSSSVRCLGSYQGLGKDWGKE